MLLDSPLLLQGKSKKGRDERRGVVREDPT